jgi:hypothetical protein
VSNYVIQSRKFPEGAGHTIRSSVEAEHGLLEDAEDTHGVDNESCCGIERVCPVLRMPLRTRGICTNGVRRGSEFRV